MKINWFLFLVIILQSCAIVESPNPVLPIPREQQVIWQEMEYYGFIHFGINTFVDKEWGYGDKSAKIFNPSNLDVRQWARVAKESGMKGLIVTVKHHDGFCLWPSKYTEYSVKNSPWKNGKGDLIKELAKACKEYELKMGIYLSPWDRNHPDYGKPNYIKYFRNQLTELLTNYGDIFEVWFDGANGGDGYYGGAKEIRTVDKKTYYDWNNTNKLIRKLQPNAIIWSDNGPDARWIGNEHGFSYKTTWSPLLRDSIYGGMTNYAVDYAMGQENGTHWVPGEADVSIRPNWFYHKSDDDKVKTLKQLLDIYYQSVGRNSTLLLNIPIDKRGLVHENDEKQLKKLTAQLKRDFANNLALNAETKASNIRGNVLKYGPDKAVDGDKNTYWATDEGKTKESLTLSFKKPIQFNRLLIQEYIKLGQRVKQFSVEAEINGTWRTIERQTTIGYKRILRFENITASKIRLNFEASKGSLLISNVGVYNAPPVVEAPLIKRNKQGEVTLEVPDKSVSIFYTLNGSNPSVKSTEYIDKLNIHEPTTIKAFVFDSITNRKSEVTTKNLDISKKLWEISTENGIPLSELAIDDDIKTNWPVSKQILSKSKINLGKITNVIGFTYTPTQTRWVSGVITHYKFYGSIDGENWIKLSSGEFSNIIANPIQQKVIFKKSIPIKYIKLVADRIMGNKDKAIIAEIGIISNKQL